jgi:hypothetical protein
MVKNHLVWYFDTLSDVVAFSLLGNPAFAFLVQRIREPEVLKFVR